MGSILFYTTLLAVSAFVLNLPFGYLRAASTKFSIKWFLYIHLPIPFIIALRWSFGVGYNAAPFVVVSAVAGQFLGGRLNKKTV